MQSSFSGADFCPDKEEDAGNPLWLFKDDDEVWAKIRPQKPARIRFLLPLGLIQSFYTIARLFTILKRAKNAAENTSAAPVYTRACTPKSAGTLMHLPEDITELRRPSLNVYRLMQVFRLALHVCGCSSAFPVLPSGKECDSL